MARNRARSRCDGGRGLRVVLVEPRHEGNVGSAARVMKNLGCGELWLVNPCRLGTQARAMAAHAQDVLTGARTVAAFDDALRGVRLVVGTTARDLPRTPARGPLLLPRDLRRHVEAAGGRAFGARTLEPGRSSDRSGSGAALLLGPEDRGLRAEELERCDIVVRIPTDPAYPSMNVSHALAILLYELAGLEPEETPRATKVQAEGFLRHLGETLRDAGFPASRTRRTLQMARKMVGRAHPTPHELKALRGALRKVQNAMRIAREKSSSAARRRR